MNKSEKVHKNKKKDHQPRPQSQRPQNPRKVRIQLRKKLRRLHQKIWRVLQSLLTPYRRKLLPNSDERFMTDALEMVGKTLSFLPAASVTEPTEHEPAGRRSRPGTRSGPTSLNIPIPYKSPTYETEKRQGIRRANGARKLKKLSNRHLQILSMHLQGDSGETISTHRGITVITVSRVLNDPVCKNLLSRIYEDRQNELDALA